MRDGLALLALGLGVLLAIIVLLPPEGRVAGPLHDLVALLLGRATFLLPLGLLLAGGTALIHAWAPEVPLPASRLAGLALVALAALPAEHLVGLGPGESLARAEARDGAGLVGHWLGTALLEWLGGPATSALLGVALLVGALLVVDLTAAQLAAGLWRAGRWSSLRVGAIAPDLAARRPSLPLPRGRWPFRPRQPAADPPPAPPPPAPVPPDPPLPWRMPKVELFKQRPTEEIRAVDLDGPARLIEETLASFNIEARVVEANRGPAVTQFGVEPALGVAVNRILSRQNDLALRLAAAPIRLEAPVPGKRMVGVEVPNATVATVTLRDVLASAEWDQARGKLRLALGRDVSGKAIVGDVGRMPHLLIAGATGAGKSVCINTIIASLLSQFTPDDLQLLMIDPKRVELVGFAELPHLRLPVVTDMEQVVGALKWVVLEMDRRYTLFARHAVRNLEGYNRRSAGVGAGPRPRPSEEPRLPYLVVVIDELADMMMTAAEEVEKTLCRLAQLARAVGIHLVVATQRPSVDVLTGLIKANFPTRIAFAVSSQTDSRVILDQAGAEKLLGRGDGLFLPPDAMKPIRLQGAFVSDDEVRDLVRHWAAQGPPRYTPEEVEQVEALGRGADEDDDVYERAVELAETVGRLSVSLLQRRLGIGRDRAQRLLDRLVDEGLAEE